MGSVWRATAATRTGEWPPTIPRRQKLVKGVRSSLLASAAHANPVTLSLRRAARAMNRSHSL